MGLRLLGNNKYRRFDKGKSMSPNPYTQLNIASVLPNLNISYKTKRKQTPWLLVRKRTIPTERPPLVGEVSANFCG
jgi:hypothetical protein